VTRNVSGILYDQNGNLATSVTIVVTRIEPVESIDGSLSVMAESKNTLKTNATTAAWDVDLYPGLHDFTFHTVHGTRKVRAAIPNGTGALDWAALSPQMPEYTPSLVSQAIDAAATATTKAAEASVDADDAATSASEALVSEVTSLLAASTAGTTLYASSGDLPTGGSLPADGTWGRVQTANGMQAWQVVTGAWALIGWITRPQFDTFAEFIAASYTFTAGTVVTIQGITATYTATSGTGNLGQANAGGQEWDVSSNTSGVRAWGAVGDGVTDDTAAIQAAVDSGNPVFFPSGTYALDGAIDIGAGAKLYGSGIGKSTLLQTSSGPAHVIDALSTSTKGGIEIVGLTIDCNGVDAGFVAQYVSNISIRYCEFKNSPFWPVNIGKSDDPTVSTIVNDQIEILGCSFSNITQTYEHLLIFNSTNVVVRDCHFEGAPDGNGLGFWQNVDRADVVNCVFNNLSVGAYYSLSTNNIRFSGCSFTNCTSGLRGANLSDHGNFGATHAYNISVSDCTFKSNSGTPCQLGAVNGGIVSGCVFDTNNEFGLLVDDGAIIEPYNAQCYNLTISDCLFFNNNESNITSQTAPGVRFAAIGGSIGATISGCQFWDTRGTPRQLYPITFTDAFVWDDVVISNCTLNAYSGAISIALSGGASVGSNVIAVDNSNMTTTIADDVKRRDARAMWQDFGDGQAQLISTSTAIARVTASAGNVAIVDLGNATDPDGGRFVYDTGNNFEIYTASTARVRVESGGIFRPSTDNTQSLGSGSFRWSEVFSGTGTINTSDATEKQQFTDISDAEKAVASALKASLKKFKFNDAVSRKGDAARWHFGVVAQEVEAAFSAAGLSATDYGVFCEDTWDVQEEIIDEETGHVVQEAREAGSRLGVRYDELLAFILAAM